jgi:hypothetical protein
VRAHQDLQAEPHIRDAASHRPLHVHQLYGQQAVLGRHIARIGHAAGSGPDRGDAAGIGGIAQRAADIVAKADRAHAARERRGLAAARAAGGTARMPGIFGQAVQRTDSVNA